MSLGERIGESHHASETERRLLASLHYSQPVSELTHNFYRYPARMSPMLPRELIAQFTNPGDTVLDPFMGGGTSVVEALAAGRRAIGVDLNPLAVFIATTKTTPLNSSDHRFVRQWAREIDAALDVKVPSVDTEPRVKNLPLEKLSVFARALEAIGRLPTLRQQQFARCVLLRTGQWALDCKTGLPSDAAIMTTLSAHLEDMLAGIGELAAAVRCGETNKGRMNQKRRLLLRSIIGLDDEPLLRGELGNVKLVITSPPYPGVHVLYHRWQVHGRRETPAPYWFINAQDGHGAAHYTLGSRSAFGLRNYFRSLTDAYGSVRPFLHPEALIAQLVAFSDAPAQLPAFLDAMDRAGYVEANPFEGDREQLWRAVPGRRWYNHLNKQRAPARELLLLHRLQE